MKKIFLFVMILMSLYANAVEKKNGYAKVSTDDDLYDPSLGNKILVYKLSTGGYIFSDKGNIDFSARSFIKENIPGRYNSPEEAIKDAISLGVCGSKRADYKRYSCYTKSGNWEDANDDKTKGSKNLPNLPNPTNNNSSNATNNNNPNNGMQASNKPAEPNKPQQPTSQPTPQPTPHPTPNPQPAPVPTPKIPNVPKIPSEEWINKWRDHWIEVFDSFSKKIENERKILAIRIQECRSIYSAGTKQSSDCVDRMLESYKKTIEEIKERIERARSDMQKEAAELSKSVKNVNKNVPHPNAGGDDVGETSQNNGNNNANPNGENNSGSGDTTNNFGGDTNVTNNNVTVNNNTSKTVVNKGDGGSGNQVGIDKGNGDGNGKKGNCEGDKGTVGCAQLGSEKDYPKDGSISISKSDFGLPSFSRSNNFVEQGSCPAPKSITLMGTVQVVDYSQLCNGALKLRPIIIACAIFIAFGIVRSAIISKT